MTRPIFRRVGMQCDVDIAQLPDGKRYAEISRKAPLDEAARAMGMMKSMLSRAGVERCPDQSSPIEDKLRSLAR